MHFHPLNCFPHLAISVQWLENKDNLGFPEMEPAFIVGGFSAMGHKTQLNVTVLMLLEHKIISEVVAPSSV